MPRIARELSALEVKRLVHPGADGLTVVAVGGVSGLMLQFTPAGGRSWVLRASVGGRRREMGLGSYPEVSLAQARDTAREFRDKIRQGIDPVEERRAARAELVIKRMRNMKFSDAVEKCLAAKLDSFKNPKHRQQWENTLATYATPLLGEMQVADITVHDVFRVLEPLWQTKTETASRLRGRIETVLAWATVRGHRSGENPARWGGNLKELLPAPSKVAEQENQPAIQLADAARWFSALHKLSGTGSRALEFTALTASRSAMVRGATWDEIDLTTGLWVIPAERMKMKREHRVPLAVAAQRLLKALPRPKDNGLVFSATRGGELSDMTLSATMARLHETDLAKGGVGFVDGVNKRPAVPHGLRSTFRDWVADRTNYAGEMAEVALAHQVASAVEAAYRRGHMVEKRREMMDEWANFLTGSA